MNRINIKQLALLLSLHPSTISRALADHPDIKPETKNRVKAAASEFNYIPNLHARYFRKKSSGLIALILPEFNMFFVPGLLDGITKVLDASGHSLIIFYSGNSYVREKEIINHCLSWVVEGILISVAQDTIDCTHLIPLKNEGIPIVMLDKVVFSDHISTVTIDDAEAAREATVHLINNDKKNILGVFGNPGLEITKQRVKGFETALNQHQIPYTNYDILYFNNDDLTIKKLENLVKTTPYDAAFVMSDEILIAMYTLLRKLKLYPDIFSLIAISDGKLPYQLYPKISHIHHSGTEVGMMAARVLIRIKDKEESCAHHTIKTTLVELDSVFI